MERLTEPGYKYHSCDFMDDGLYIQVNRLSRYEDTGLSPEQIQDLKERDTEKIPDYEGDGYAEGHMVYDTWICPNCGERTKLNMMIMIFARNVDSVSRRSWMRTKRNLKSMNQNGKEDS